MINLSCATRVEIDDITSIIKEKYSRTNTALETLKPRILSRYVKFIDLETNKRIVPIAFTTDEKNALLSLYGSQTKTAKAITGQVLDYTGSHGDRCPYCGLGEFDEIDHYLPKEHFPEYSILHKNLIPICGKCNKTKGEKIPGQGFDCLHLVYDILPVDNIYDCQLTFKNKMPLISFSILPKYQTSLLNTHFEDLKLKARMEKQARLYCLRIKAVKEKFDAAFAKDEVGREFLISREFFGSFYWKTKLLEMMIANDFVDNVD